MNREPTATTAESSGICMSGGSSAQLPSASLNSVKQQEGWLRYTNTFHKVHQQSKTQRQAPRSLMPRQKDNPKRTYLTGKICVHNAFTSFTSPSFKYRKWISALDVDGGGKLWISPFWIVSVVAAFEESEERELSPSMPSSMNGVSADSLTISILAVREPTFVPGFSRW